MNYEEDFRNTIQNTIVSLESRQRPMWECSANGMSFRGWFIDTEHRSSEEGTPGSWHREYWENWTILLLPDGRFVRVGYSATGGAGAETVRTESASELALNYFVGNVGAPFSDWKARLERLPYR